MSTSIAASAEEFQDPSALSLFEVLTWLGQRKRRIAAVTLVCTTAALALALATAPVFTAHTMLLPPSSQQQQASSAVAAMSQLGGLAGNFAKTPDELYLALLKSDSVLAVLDQRFQLRERYGLKTFTALRRTMPKYVRATSEKKSGVITLEVDDEDPEFSAKLANGYAQALTELLGRLAVGEAKQRRLFFEAQLRETKERLIQAEQDFRKMQESSGVIVLDKQAEALIGTAAALRAQIAARDVQMKVLRTGATEQNPEVQRLASELRALRGELTRLESSAGAAVNPGGNHPPSVTDMPVGRIPEAAVEFVRARRELKLQETLLESMVRQYEIAKLDEAKEGPVLQQVDVARPPDARSKPARALILLGGLLGGLALGCGWTIGQGLLQRQRQMPDWQSLRAAWRWRKD